MADAVRINIAGDRQVGLRFEQFPDQLYDALRDEIDSLAHDLFSSVGARIPERTGRLRSQLRVRVFADKTKISGRVDIAGKGSGKNSDFAKAATLEYGSTGKKANVSAHDMKIDHYWSERLSRPITKMTKAYSRTPKVPEFAFERGALAGMQSEILNRLNAVVENAVQDANG